MTSLCVCMRVCVRECMWVSIPNAINTYWCDRFNRFYGFYVAAVVGIIGRCDVSIGVLHSSTYS